MPATVSLTTGLGKREARPRSQRARTAVSEYNSADKAAADFQVLDANAANAVHEANIAARDAAPAANALATTRCITLKNPSTSTLA